jgi:hypothetical protein
MLDLRSRLSIEVSLRIRTRNVIGNDPSWPGSAEFPGRRIEEVGGIAVGLDLDARSPAAVGAHEVDRRFPILGLRFPIGIVIVAMILPVAPQIPVTG